MPVPKLLNYSYYKINQLTQNATGPNAANTLNPGDSGTVQFNAYTLHYIPKRMYIFVRPDLFSLTNQQLIECPDFFGRIDNVNIYFDNEYHLNELNSYELYKLSLKNGLKDHTVNGVNIMDLCFALSLVQILF